MCPDTLFFVLYALTRQFSTYTVGFAHCYDATDSISFSTFLIAVLRPCLF